MHIVALAAGDAQSTSSTLALLSGKRLAAGDPNRLTVTMASTGEIDYTLVGFPPYDQSTASTRLSGAALADVAIIVVAGSRGWTQEQSNMLDEMRTIGMTSVIVAVDNTEGCSASLPHAIRQQLGVYQFAQSAVVEINTEIHELKELHSALGMFLATTERANRNGVTRVWLQRAYKKEGVGSVAVGFVTGTPVTLNSTLRSSEGREYQVHALQQLDSRTDVAKPGSFVAISLGDADIRQLGEGTVLFDPSVSSLSNQVECHVRVRRNTHQPLVATQTYIAKVGTASCYAALHTLEGASLGTGHEGSVRIRLSHGLPLTKGDRILLCDLASGGLVAAGTVNEKAIALDAIEKDNVESLLRTKGWIDVDEYERMTGVSRSATLGRWVVDISALESASARVRGLVSGSGTAGLDVNSLNEKELAILRTLSGIEIVNGRAVMAGLEPDMAVRAARSTSLEI